MKHLFMLSRQWLTAFMRCQNGLVFLMRYHPQEDHARQTLSPSQLSQQLRQEATLLLAPRRASTGMVLGAMASMGVVALYQMGLIRHLPDPPLSHFDADRVDASQEAYAHLASPDAPLALASFAVTLLLTTMGGA